MISTLNTEEPVLMLSIFEFIIEPDEDRFHAYCPSLKGCRTWGHTKAEAYKNIKEVLELYLEALIDEGDPIPNIGIIENINDMSFQLLAKNVEVGHAVSLFYDLD